MNKKTVLLILLAAAVALSGCGKKPQKQEGDGKDATNVTVEAAKTTTIESTVTYTGEIKASDTVNVSAKVNGNAKTVSVTLGDFVAAGTTLMTIDATDYQLQYNQALAGYNSALASYKSVTGGSQEQKILSLKQAVASAQSEYDSSAASYEREKQMYDNNTNLVSAKNACENAKTTYDNMQNLFDMGAASQDSLNNAKTAYENAQAALTAAENSLKSGIDAAKTRFNNAKTNLDTAKKNYELTVNVVNPESEQTAKAGVNSAKAALDIAANSLNNTTIKAPISGYITSVSAAAGQLVSQGTPLFSIKNAKSVDAEINVTEAVIPFINVGTEAKIEIKSANVTGLLGHVSVASKVKDEKTGMYTVRVQIPNENNNLSVGMFADITLTTESVADALVVPSKAVLQKDDEHYVFTANGENAEKHIVTLGITNNELSQITSGINDGDSIIVSGQDYVSESNTKIKIVD